MRHLIWRWWYFINGFWDGDRGWGRVRLVVVLAAAFLYMALGRIWFEEVDTLALATSWRDSLFILRLFRVPLSVLESIAYFLNGPALRYWLIPITVSALALWVGGRYVQDIYELKQPRLGLRYLIASLFAINYPYLDIAAGRKQIKPGEVNLLDVIGGPGYLTVQPGNIVLFERLREPVSVLAAGIHFIPRHDKLFDNIASLDELPGEIKEISAYSKDGIPVSAYDVTFRYRLHASPRKGSAARRKADDPYPFSVQAMRSMTYRRPVAATGEMVPWHTLVEGTIRGVIAGAITSNTVDYLTAPKHTDKDPRPDITDQFKSKKFRESLRSLGAELLWCDIGHFGVPDPADAQRLDTWSAKWKGNATVVEAYGKAQRLAYQELARGEAQAELLLSILHALEDVNLQPEHPANLRQIILARTAGVLETLTGIGQMPLVKEE